MTENTLTLFDQAAPPEHIREFFETETNIAERETVPSLTYEGRQWTISLKGEKTQLTAPNEEGDHVPISIMRVVVLDYAKRRGRALYTGTYDPSNPGRPSCWSDDGITAGVTEPAEPIKGWTGKCAECPMAAKNSKIDDSGRGRVACSQHRMLAVIPATPTKIRFDKFPPLRLKLAMTSDWDGQSPDLNKQGWFAFKNYLDLMQARNYDHTAALVTKMKFDPGVPYPKVLFAGDRWLTPAEKAVITPIWKGEEVKRLLAGRWTPAGVDGVRVEQPEVRKADDAKKMESKNVPVVEVFEPPTLEEVKIRKAADAKKAESKGVSPVKIAEPFIPKINLDDEGKSKPAKPAAKIAREPAPAVALAPAKKLPDDVSALLADWDA